MGLLRIATVVAVGVALLPAERESQEALYQRAAATTTWVVTFCDRNEKLCQNGAYVWAQFVAKAEFGAKLAYDMVREGQAIQTAGEANAERLVAPASLKSGGDTLTSGDLKPAWRGGEVRKGSI